MLSSKPIIFVLADWSGESDLATFTLVGHCSPQGRLSESFRFFLSLFIYAVYLFLLISINYLHLIIYGIGKRPIAGDSVDLSTYLHQRVSY